MKTIRCLSSVKRLFKIAGLCVAVGLVRATAVFADEGTPKAKAQPQVVDKAATESSDLVSSITLGGNYVDVSGNSSEFQRRHQMNRSFSAGIEDLIIEQKIDKDTTFSVEGHGLYRGFDYELKLRAERAQVGHVEVGYETFRTWYNGGGGFYPGNNLWLSYYDTDMHVDRGEAWFEVVLELPDLPKLSFKYTHEFRKGDKDSLTWGDTSRTAGQTARYIVPAFRQLNEINEIFEGELEYTLDKTKIESGLRYELGDEKSAHYIRRSPEQGRLADRFFSQHENLTFDLFNYHQSTETWFTDNLMFASGYSYTTMNTHVGGDLIPGSAYNQPFDANMGFGANVPVYFNQEGGSQWNQHVVNLNLMFVPQKDWTLTTAFRAEREGSDSRTSQLDATLATPSSSFGLTNERSASTWLKLAQQLEATYKGIRDWVFYFRANMEENSNQMNENRQTNVGEPRANAIVNRDTNEEVWRQKYTLGANWYASRSVNTSVQYYHRIRENNYVNRDDSAPNGGGGDRYPAYIANQKFITDDMDCRLTWRLLNNLTAVTRYDFQLASIDTTFETLDPIKNAESTSHMLGETLTWSPLTALSLQGGVNYVLDNTWTPANSTLATTTVANSVGSAVTTSQNNYWNANFAADYALTAKTDLTAGYYYYRADNYRPDVGTQPFDSGAEEHNASFGVVHRFADNIIWTLKYGYYVNRDALSGGYNDYTAHVVNTGVQIQF